MLTFLNEPSAYSSDQFVLNTSNTYIFTNYSVYNSNNITQLYNTIITTTEFFDHLKMFNSVPNIISKIKPTKYKPRQIKELIIKNKALKLPYK